MTRAAALKLSLAALVLLWLGNTSLFEAVPNTDATRVIAHRGVHHIYAGANRSANTCRATHVEPITHSFIENTLPSMRAAFAAGADVVELDIHLTPDSVFAVFHDWTLECQTDGRGETRKASMSTLKSLDLAFNLSADGVTFPLRGEGIGLMPSLDEVLNENLSGEILINFKSNDAKEADALTELLKRRGPTTQVFGVYGGTPPTRRFSKQNPTVPTLDRPSLKQCLLRYALLGWSGYVPADCRNALVAVPANVAPFLWGWPHRFTRRMAQVNTHVILWGPYDGSGFSSGIDTLDALQHVPNGFDGYVWTNRIETIGPALRAR